MLDRAYRPALTTLLLVTITGFAFSFLGGFSIGRFTAILPLLLTAFAVTYGRAAWLQLVAYLAAAFIYVLFAWMIPEQVHYWGIQLELPICLIAYGLALLLPPAHLRRGSA